MLFLMMFMKKMKGEKQGYARIYNTRAYPLGIRSMKRAKTRPVQVKEHK